MRRMTAAPSPPPGRGWAQSPSRHCRQQPARDARLGRRVVGADDGARAAPARPRKPSPPRAAPDQHGAPLHPGKATAAVPHRGLRHVTPGLGAASRISARPKLPAGTGSVQTSCKGARERRVPSAPPRQSGDRPCRSAPWGSATPD